MDSIIEVRDLTLDLGGDRILDGMTLDLWPGHVHAVVGPNGAGKSTLASCIMGLPGYRAYQGTILFEGRDMADMGVDERARLGMTMAWQEPARFEGLSVRKFVLCGSPRNDEETAAEALELVGLSPDTYLERAVDDTLSGGERKRIELASILTMQPKLVMMDEPDSGIDVEALRRIFEAMRELRAKGATVLLITHSVTVLEQADHAFLMCCGRILEKGETEEIKKFFGEKCIPCDHQNRPEEGGR